MAEGLTAETADNVRAGHVGSDARRRPRGKDGKKTLVGLGIREWHPP